MFLLKVSHLCNTSNALTKDTDSRYLINTSQHVGTGEAEINTSDSSATHNYELVLLYMSYLYQCRFNALHNSDLI